jgi:hypothetical protein
MTKTKAIDFKKLCNFVVHNFFLFKIIEIMFEFLTFEIQTF